MILSHLENPKQISTLKFKWLGYNSWELWSSLIEMEILEIEIEHDMSKIIPRKF